ncbi:hypothetical protein VAMP_178845n409 [Candidatus Vampirococcus lugosii]|uniref:DUF2892 domain-containing protein n=1 Tax=Candidatus Vampirococcus lugosii TaxID=2789015 RepID=A0ABS5QMY2_9BACT|nr:hypothetical protein [Candidatus Vampirococcus lugosii]
MKKINNFLNKIYKGLKIIFFPIGFVVSKINYFLITIYKSLKIVFFPIYFILSKIIHILSHIVYCPISFIIRLINIIRDFF